MDEESRTGKAMKNSFVTLICQCMYLVISFACRTVFTRLLGTEYLGINGLFSNILTILSFAELGIGSALVYRMYAPLSNGDFEKIRQYLQLYKRVYRLIICVIAAAGSALIPFLQYIVDAPDVQEDIRLLYCLYLFDTLISYICVYKKSLLIADQKNYIVSIYTLVFQTVMNAAQIVFLLITRQFVIYCLIRSLCNLWNNIACSHYAERHYTYIKDPPGGQLEKDEIAGLKKDAKGLLFSKVAGITYGATDNLFISAFLGLKYVGILSNYTLLLDTFNGVMNRIFHSITASVGNLAVSENSEKIEQTLKRLFFLNTAIYGYICLGMLLLIREFITEIWFTPEYELSQILVSIILLEYFLRSVHYPLNVTRNALGCFSQYRGWLLVLSGVNIALDFIFVKPFGIAGLYMATIFCRGIAYLIDIRVVYQMKLKKRMRGYLNMLIIWLFFLGILGAVMSPVVAGITCSGIWGFVVKAAVITLGYIVSFVLVFYRTNEFAYYRQLVQKLIGR